MSQGLAKEEPSQISHDLPVVNVTFAVGDENSPKDNQSQHSELSNLIIREEFAGSGGSVGSQGDAGSADGDWEVLDETNIAVDYSNVHVFLKTLKTWQDKGSSKKASDVATGDKDQEEISDLEHLDLQVNLDEALCAQVFASSSEKELDSAQVAELLFSGGYISLDTVDTPPLETDKPL